MQTVPVNNYRCGITCYFTFVWIAFGTCSGVNFGHVLTCNTFPTTKWSYLWYQRTWSDKMEMNQN